MRASAREWVVAQSQRESSAALLAPRNVTGTVQETAAGCGEVSRVLRARVCASSVPCQAVHRAA